MCRREKRGTSMGMTTKLQELMICRTHAFVTSAVSERFAKEDRQFSDSCASLPAHDYDLNIGKQSVVAVCMNWGQRGTLFVPA